LCSPTTRDYLINYARTFIYTTALSFLSLASIETTYNFVATGQAEPLLQNLRFLIRETHKRFVALCSKHKAPTDILRVNTEPSKSPILPVFTHHPWSLAKHCQDKGFMVRPITAPTVPAGSERIRVTLHASNTMAEVEGLVAAVEAWLVTTTRERTSQSPTGRLAERGHGSRQHSATPPGAGRSSPKL
jgi:8-amino-7-oxononanoate synthase